MIEAANVAAIVGLGIACVGFLWANRLLPVEISQRSRWELVAFCAVDSGSHTCAAEVAATGLARSDGSAGCACLLLPC
jgi:hypothetical protein